MPISTSEPPPVSLRLSSANTVTSDIPVGLSTPSSLDVDHEGLTRTVYYAHEGKSIAFEVVNKPVTLTKLDSTVMEVGPVSNNTFGGILKAIIYSCVPRKTRRV